MLQLPQDIVNQILSQRQGFKSILYSRMTERFRTQLWLYKIPSSHGRTYGSLKKRGISIKIDMASKAARGLLFMAALEDEASRGTNQAEKLAFTNVAEMARHTSNLTSKDFENSLRLLVSLDAVDALTGEQLYQTEYLHRSLDDCHTNSEKRRWKLAQIAERTWASIVEAAWNRLVDTDHEFKRDFLQLSCLTLGSLPMDKNKGKTKKDAYESLETEISRRDLNDKRKQSVRTWYAYLCKCAFFFFIRRTPYFWVVKDDFFLREVALGTDSDVDALLVSRLGAINPDPSITQWGTLTDNLSTGRKIGYLKQIERFVYADLASEQTLLFTGGMPDVKDTDSGVNISEVLRGSIFP